MQDLLIVCLMACAMEGILYALMPEKVQEAMRIVVQMKPEILRAGGLIVAAAAVTGIVLIRG